MTRSQWTRNRIVETLVRDQGYTTNSATRVAAQLLTALPEIREQAFAFLEGRKAQLRNNVEEFTFEKLVANGLNTIAALLTMNWLLVEPNIALPVVRRGHDKITASKRQEPQS